MNGLIKASLRNPIAVTVLSLAAVVLGVLSAYAIPVDILPVFKSPAVQTLVFYGGMPAASIEKNITARLERGVVQAIGGRRIESRSIVGASIVRDYFRSNVDRSGALTEVNSLAGWEYPTMPPGTLPVVLPYDPTSATPVCLLALDSPSQNEATLFDVGRYEVRPQIMSQPGAIAPLVYGGKQVYVPVFRQLGASTLQVVDTLRGALETMKSLTREGIDLKLVMDQSVYVRQSIESLAEEARWRGALLAGDPPVPGPVADDGDRRADDPDRGAGGPRRPVRDAAPSARSTSICSAQVSSPTRASPTWNSPSTPAA